MVIPGGGKGLRTDALPGGWSILPFGAVLEGGTRNGIYKPKEFHGDGCHIVNMGELFAYPRLDSVPMRRVRITGEELDRFGLQVGDLLFARRSLVAEGAGKCAIVCGLREPTVFESSIIRARPNQRLADSYYLYYLFNSPFGTYSLGTILRHVAVAGITGSDLVRLTIPVPPLQTQRAIANVLRALDDKIESNRRMNETLESIARAIFKSWFVDFDAVRAKATGRQPVGMDTDAAALFPAGWQQSALGRIPSGWSVAPIGDLVRAVGGSTPRTDNRQFWNGGTIHWATPKDLSGLSAAVLLDTERRITEEGVRQISSGVLPVGTLLLSSRAPIGYLAISEVPLAVNQGFIAMVCDRDLPNHYVLHWARHNTDAIMGRAGGTTFQEISKANFRSIPSLRPSDSVLRLFTGAVEPLHHAVVGNLKECRTLAALRDALLPKLLCGQVYVRKAERVVGRHV